MNAELKAITLNKQKEQLSFICITNQHKNLSAQTDSLGAIIILGKLGTCKHSLQKHLVFHLSVQ